MAIGALGIAGGLGTTGKGIASAYYLALALPWALVFAAWHLVNALKLRTTATLLSGDLLTHAGKCPALTESDCVAPAMEAEEVFHATGLTTNLGPTLEQLAQSRHTSVQKLVELNGIGVADQEFGSADDILPVDYTE
jgi:hypothetical protein